MLFGISCRWYRYRERDEVVNVQGMIESIYENELLQQENEGSDDSIYVYTLSNSMNYNTFH
jgi:hypothetical protein